MAIRKMLNTIGRVSTYICGGDNGVRIAGTILQRGGSVKVEGNVQIGEGIDMVGIMTLKSVGNRKVVVRGKSSMNGKMSTEGDVTFEYVLPSVWLDYNPKSALLCMEEANAKGRNLTVRGILNIEGMLLIRANLETRGCIYLKKGSRLIVDGKKSITGVKKEVDEFQFKP